MASIVKFLYNYLFGPSSIVQVQMRANDNARRGMLNGTLKWEVPMELDPKYTVDVVTKSGPKSINIHTFDIKDNKFTALERDNEWTCLFRVSGTYTNDPRIYDLVNSGIKSTFDQPELNDVVFKLYKCFFENCNEVDKEYVLAYAIVISNNEGHSSNIMVCRLLNNELGFWTAKFCASC